MLVRIISGILGIALATLVIQTGGVLFAAAVLVLMFVGWQEFTRALEKTEIPAAFALGALSLVLLWGGAWQGERNLLFAIVVGIVLVTFIGTVVPLGRVLTFPTAAQTIVGVLYLGLPFGHLIMLRNLPGTDFAAAQFDFTLDYGAALVWLAFIATWCSDSFAYFVGSAIGRHKLAPTVSPNKTIEGFCGSLVGTSVVLMAVAYIFNLSVVKFALLGACLAVVATLGDLVESAFKRYAGIKDSGNLIPGHGGVLDRFDSVLYTVPTVYYYALLAGVR